MISSMGAIRMLLSRCRMRLIWLVSGVCASRRGRVLRRRGRGGGVLGRGGGWGGRRWWRVLIDGLERRLGLHDDDYDDGLAFWCLAGGSYERWGQVKLLGIASTEMMLISHL